MIEVTSALSMGGTVYNVTQRQEEGQPASPPELQPVRCTKCISNTNNYSAHMVVISCGFTTTLNRQLDKILLV